MDTTPMRFCMITTFYPPYNFGGDGIFVQRLVEALAERGHHVTVIHCVDAFHMTAHREPRKCLPEHPNIEVHSLESGVGIISPLITHQFATPGLKAKKIANILEAGNFDVIHYHNISLVGGPALMAYGDAIKIYTAHEYWLLCPLSTLWKPGLGPCTEKHCISCTVKAGKPPQWWRYTRALERGLAHLDALTAPSQFMIDKHREMGLDAEFTHLPNFLPLDKTQDRPNPGATAGNIDRPYFLLVGRLDESKGFQRVIEAFRDFPHADLAVIGKGPYEEELHKLAAGADNIHFYGKRQYKELTTWYRGAVALIVPSIWFEPFGLIVIEAYAQGTPVIVNNAGALPELVASSGGGIVYDDNQQMLEAVQRLLDSPQRRNELGERGYDAYQAQWTEEQHLAQYLQLVSTIKARKAGARADA